MQEYGTSAKRKRSVSAEALPQPAPPVKVAKMHSHHLQINYLARQHSEILPLISREDPLPSILSLISDYDGVLQRHESMAGNLGARPLGPILIKRFERLFDGPPRVLKSHGKDGSTVGWLDVVEFAKNKPDQFNLEKTRDGVRVCQFYTKQSRVEITEEDYEIIASGMPQKLIPPQPIAEDEEKELGTLEILEKQLGYVVQLADQGAWPEVTTDECATLIATVSARARQLNHRLKNRKNAIIGRREAEAPKSDHLKRSNHHHNARVADMGQSSLSSNGDRHSSASPFSGFVAVNSKHPVLNEPAQHDAYMHDRSTTANVTIVNGTSLHGVSDAVRNELLGKFLSNNEIAASTDHEYSRRPSVSASRPSGTSRLKGKPTSEPADHAGTVNSASPVPIPNTPTSLLPYVKPSSVDRIDDNGPYKAAMVSRMEQLQRGDRIQPPCDRCRRLHMDCRKNLTACMGCTKKHAKCSWKDVLEDELRENPYNPSSPMDENGADESSDREGSSHLPPVSSEPPPKREYPRDDHIGVRDEELLGEDPSGDEDGEQGPEATEVAGSSPQINPTPATAGQPDDVSESPKTDPGHGSSSADETPIFDIASYENPHAFPSVNGKAADAERVVERESEPDGGAEESHDALVQLSIAAGEAAQPSQQKAVAVYGPTALVAAPASGTMKT